MAVSLNGDGTITGLSTLSSVTITGLTSLTTTDLTADTTTLVVDSVNNRVGIGTASPSTTLQVVGTATATAFSGPLTGNVTGDVSGNAGTVTNGVYTTDIGSTVQAYDADTTKNDVANTFTANQTINGNLTVDTNTLYVDSTNNRVGVGTSSPATTFEVSGNAFFGSSNNTSVGAYVVQAKSTANWNFAGLNLIRNATNTTVPRFIGMPLDGDNLASTTIGDYNSIWGEYDSSPTTGSTSASLNGKMIYGAYAGHQWRTNGTERMRITSTGNVGIGTSSPNSKLSIDHSSSSTTAFATYDNIPLLIKDTSNTDNNWSIIAFQDSQNDFASYIGTQYTSQASSTAVLTFGTNPGSGATERMRIDSSGNVGIGTTSPNAKLVVSGGSEYITNTASNSAGIEIAGNGNTPTTTSLFVGQGSTSLGFVYQRANSDLLFGTNNTERMRIQADGKLLYGFTSSQSGGHWQHYTPANNYNIQFFSEYASGTGYFLEFIRSVSGSYNAVGTITASTTTTTYATSSDYRLKNNVAPMSGSIDRLKQLKPSTWSWTQDGSHGEGFLAHEAQSVVPEAVTGTKDAMKTEEYEVTPAVKATYDEEGNELTPAVEAVMGTREVPDYQGIDQSKLVPLLTAALQEAITKIENLETRIEALEAK